MNYICRFHLDYKDF